MLFNLICSRTTGCIGIYTSCIVNRKENGAQIFLALFCLQYVFIPNTTACNHINANQSDCFFRKCNLRSNYVCTVHLSVLLQLSTDCSLREYQSVFMESYIYIVYSSMYMYHNYSTVVHCIMKVWKVIYHAKANYVKLYFLTVCQNWLGVADPEKCIQIIPNPFQNFVTEF